jgi:hypothetical protein
MPPVRGSSWPPIPRPLQLSPPIRRSVEAVVVAAGVVVEEVAGAAPRAAVRREADLLVVAVVKVAAHPAHPAVGLPEVAAEMFPGVACPE